MRQHVVYVLGLSMTLTYTYVGGGGILGEFYLQFLSCFFINLLYSWGYMQVRIMMGKEFDDLHRLWFRIKEGPVNG